MNTEPNIDVSLDVSIPGSNEHDQPEPMQRSQYSREQPVRKSFGQHDGFALQAACKEELSHGIHPKFYTKAVEYKAETRAKGHPIFKDQDWVIITIAGDRNSKHDRKVTEIDRNRWPALYHMFKSGQEVSIVGTPLEQWPIMTPAQCENLKHYNIFTVEEVAGLSDQAMQSIGMGTRELTEKAKAYLESAENSALPQQMTEQIKQLQEQVTALQTNNQQLGEAAGSAESNIVELQTLRENARMDETKIQTLEGQNSQMNDQITELNLNLSTVKNDLKVANGQAKRAKQDVTALKKKIKELEAPKTATVE